MPCGTSGGHIGRLRPSDWRAAGAFCRTAAETIRPKLVRGAVSQLRRDNGSFRVQAFFPLRAMTK